MIEMSLFKLPFRFTFGSAAMSGISAAILPISGDEGDETVMAAMGFVEVEAPVVLGIVAWAPPADESSTLEFASHSKLKIISASSWVEPRIVQQNNC
jgi:hypothetical protein